jgi:hypothetical protein
VHRKLWQYLDLDTIKLYDASVIVHENSFQFILHFVSLCKEAAATLRSRGGAKNSAHISLKYILLSILHTVLRAT